MQVQNKEDILLRLKKHRAILKNFGVEQIGLFGSFVKNRQKKSSDVDLLVKFAKSKKTFRNFIQFAAYVETLLGRNVEVLTPESMSPYLAPYIKKETEYVKIAS